MSFGLSNERRCCGSKQARRRGWKRSAIGADLTLVRVCPVRYVLIYLVSYITSLVRQRFGRGVDITGAPEVLKKRSLRYYNTFEYVNEAPMFILRFRYRIWEDIGTLHVAYPIEGVHRRGKLHVRARTRHNKWILVRLPFAWAELSCPLLRSRKRRGRRTLRWRLSSAGALIWTFCSTRTRTLSLSSRRCRNKHKGDYWALVTL